MSESTSSQFDGLKQKLEKQNNWPQMYLFKFIIPNDNHKLAQVEALFGPEAQVSRNQSRTGKFISVTAKELMISVDEVISRYEKSTLIEGLISL
tara:strand:- start:1132 stop:1413 length:282 start_codon:yes stop_codon:yes gene_type:complete